MSGATARNIVQATQRFMINVERNLLDRTNWSIMLGLLEKYGPWPTMHKRFSEWKSSGLIEKIFHVIGEDADLEEISIDSIISR